MTLRVLFHNVGHGQAIHAFLPSGHVVVVDLGCSGDFSPLAWLRTKTDVIDQLIITHPHGDHIDEILDLTSHEFTVRQLWRPKWLTEAEIRKANQANYRQKVDAYMALSKTYESPIPHGELVGEPANCGGVSIQRFASSGCGRANINNHSGVVVIEYLGIRLLVPGDNEPESWKELLANPHFTTAAAGADVIMASHHGRESGYHADVFDNKRGIGKPRLCIVSDGRVLDTDARERYTYHASGWPVHSRAGGDTVRRSCVTTRSDGYIDIEIGSNNPGVFLSVKSD